MKETVLITGSSNAFKAELAAEFIKLGKRVIIVNPKDHRPKKYPKGVKAFHFDSFGERSILKNVVPLAKAHNVTHVSTIQEEGLEAGALVRQELGLPGYTPKEIEIARNKGVMYRFLKRENILNPRFRVFKRGVTRKSIIAVARGLKFPLVIKPALGAGNSGVRFVRSIKELWKQYSSTLREVSHHGFDTFDFRPWAGEWIICEFIAGKEVEADLYVEGGKIKFKIVQDKPLLVERNGILEENTSVTPPVSLTRRETQSLDRALVKLVKVVYEKLAGPCGIKYFTLYPEYIIDKNGDCYCLEFALRICGAIGPMVIQKSTGVNMMEVFVRASLGLKTRIKKRKKIRAICWQTLLSDRRGRFCGLKSLDGAETFMYAKKGDCILTPQSDYIASVITEGRTPRDALKKMATTLKKAKILVKIANRIEEISVPIPKLPA